MNITEANLKHLILAMIFFSFMSLLGFYCKRLKHVWSVLLGMKHVWCMFLDKACLTYSARCTVLLKHVWPQFSPMSGGW